MSAIRLIDAGRVSHLRSQTLYHGLAHARTDDSPNTVVLATPAEPYVCIGYHQDVEREVDVEFCQRQGLPILRRETGGGVVYLDDQQLFVQWIMAPLSLPPRVDQRFELFCRPLVDTYRDFGIDATLRPINDVHAGGRKISGTGAAQIGNAEVLTGNFLFDFDTSIMAGIVQAPSETFRAQVAHSLQRYMTSMRRELDAIPARDEVAHSYARRCADALDCELVAGELTDSEVHEIERQDERLGKANFLHQPGRMRRGGVKIHEDVWVVEAEHDLDECRVRLTARLREHRIEELELNSAPSELATALTGVVLQPGPVRRALNGYNTKRAASLDVTAWAEALLELDPTAT
ncbi:MAG: ligase [Planctomycetes bacterium]|nr:ligase [Planctomycetota bacterium]MDP6423392.1 biotin/lipoate A/B protein ligase family protein [Planctomycetota bacterium]